MASQEVDPSVFQEHMSQHRELRALLARIDNAFQKSSPSVDEIGELLGQLGDRLVKHFTCEEEGGYFSEALLHAPQLLSKANALLAQHPKMCTEAQNLVVNLQQGKATDADWCTHTAALFRTFRDELLRHEKQENALLQEAYQRDIGITD
jgi:hemerythrin